VIHVDWLREGEVARIRPEGPVDEADFDTVASAIDPVIAERGRLEGLMVDARGFEGWDDMPSLLAHLRFVHAHQPKVARIAVLGDQWWLTAAPAVEPVYGTPVRVFAGAEEAAARAWLLETPPAPTPVTVLPGTEGPVVGVRIAGRLRDADTESLRETLRAHLPEDGGIRLLAVIDEEFRGWTPRACLDDLAFAFSPWRHRFEKLAVVAGPGMVRWWTEHFPTALLPYPVKVFGRDETEAAWAWLRA